MSKKGTIEAGAEHQMVQWRYRAEAEDCPPLEGGPYHSFGIVLEEKQPDGWVVLRGFHDVTRKEPVARQLAAQWNAAGVHPFHSGDVLEDVLP